MPVILKSSKNGVPQERFFFEVSVKQCFAAQWVANYKNPKVVFKVIMCL